MLKKVIKLDVKLLKRFIWTVESRGDDLFLQKENKVELRYPHIWLRDNCQCPKCFHATSNSRIIDIEHFPFNTRPEEVEVNNTSLRVDWSDSHRSTYSLPWLIQRNFTPDNQTKWLETKYRVKAQPWSAANFNAILRRFNYEDILKREEVLLEWLEALAVHGVAIVDGAGGQSGKLQAIANKVAFLKQTYYGETFTVRAKPGTSNVAYLSGALQLHSDLPYYNYKPGVNMLHCISQVDGAGGESQLSDGLSVSSWLRDNHPYHYWILSSVPVEWEDVVCENGTEYHTINRAPVICEEPGGSGEIVRINWSQPQRGSHFNIPVDQVTPWYRAVELFAKHMHSVQSKVFFKLMPGEILTFNNVRILHGRSHYEGERHLEGGYLDWDYIYSKIRVLQNRFFKG